MIRGIFIVLLLIAIIAGVALYYINQGPSVLMKPPTEQYIAFISDNDGQRDVWIIKPNGEDINNVTKDAADDILPAWSPDGKEIIMISDMKNDTYQIYISAWNGKYKNQLTSSTGSKDNPIWNHDGTELAFISSGKVYVMNKNSKDEEQFLPAHDSLDMSSFSGGSSAYVKSSWSFNSQEMLNIQMENQDKKVSIVDQTKSHDVKPVNILVAQDTDASWSPIDKRVAVSYINKDGNNGLMIFDYDTLNRNELIITKGDTYGFSKPEWSPDGKMIAYEKWTLKDGFPDKCVGIYGIQVSGGNAFTIAEGNAKQPKYSPDGKYLAYTLADNTGRRDLMIYNLDTNEVKNLTNGSGDNFDVFWSPLPIKK